jgi:hypothetical protein
LFGVLDGAATLYFIPNGPLTYRLQDQLPTKLGVYGGGLRIWWPGLNDQSDPYDHPLVHDKDGVYGSRALTIIEQKWREGPPEHPEAVQEI